MPYSSESDVYDQTGLDTDIVQSLGGKNSTQVTTLINSFITQADARIKGLMKVPITVRKERHEFDGNSSIELGLYEDEFEMFSCDDPTDCVDTVYAIFTRHGSRYKLPYPKNCDDLTEATTGWANVANSTLSAEATIVKCGTKSIKAVFSAAGSFKYTTHLDKNIETWGYIGLWLYTSDETAVFTVTLEDESGNTATKTFSNTDPSTWQIVQLILSEFTKSAGFGGWDYTHKLQHITIASSKACTIYLDNLCFNDGVFWTQPEGLINWSDPDSDPFDVIYVTYSYDPFKVTTPEVIKKASAKIAGIDLLNYLIGRRQRTIGFEVESDNLEERPDRQTLESTRNRLQREAEELIANIGYGAYEGIG
jgi:hypothetical protein